MNVTTYTKRPVHSLLNIIKRALHVAGPVSAHKAAHCGRITRLVAHALALKPRGAVPKDVLAINSLVVGLRVEWFARDVHPWDRDLSERRKAELFAQQCLEDVDAAIPRLFERLPEIDVLEIAVLERGSQKKIISGIVRRSDLAARIDSSLGMRLKTIGVTYRYTDLKLEPVA